VPTQRERFPKASRLLKPAEFTRVYKTGRKLYTKNFVLHLLPNGLTTARLGLSVSARVGPAVARNRIKRLVREFFRRNTTQISPGVSVDIVVSVKRGAALRDLESVEEELLKVLCEKNRP